MALRSLLVIAVLAMGKQVEATEVTGLNNHYGSTNGATIIRISGSEFADDSFNAFDPNLGNAVYLYSDTKEYECEVDKDATDENSITCSTRPMQEDTYYVRLKVNGVDISSDSYCGGNPKDFQCSFRVVWWRTPLIRSISPESGLPGQLSTISGRLFTDKLRSADQAASNGITASIRRVWFSGGQACQLFDGFDTPYGIELVYNEETDSYTNTGVFSCRIIGSFVSSLNASFIVDEDYGRSRQLPSVFKVSSDYRLYMYQSYAEITSVSPTTGSLYGGTEISIQGNYFDDTAIQVTVGGAECGLTSKTDNLVTCITSSNDDLTFADTFPGGRGVHVEVYEGLADPTAIDGVSYDDYSGSKSKFTTDNSAVSFVASSSPVVIRVVGFFIPAVDGHYRLYSTKASDTTIYLSTDSTSSMKTLAGNEVFLTAGNHYYYEMVHSESTLQVDVTMIAYLRETLYNYNQTSMAAPERQTIVTSSPDDHEIQTITLTDWDVVTDGENEQFTLCITCKTGQTCTGSEEYYIGLHGVQTANLLASGDAASLKDWIESLPTMHGDTVTVVKDSDLACFSKYTVTVDSSLGSLPLEAHAVSTQAIEVDLTVSVTAKVERTAFTLAINGIPSSRAEVGDQSSVENAVKSLFAPSCPSKLEQLGSPWLAFDFDSGVMSDSFSESSGEITGEDSYCGVKSLKNPATLTMIGPFFNNQIDDNSKFCIAHKGMRTFTVDIHYLYTSTNALESDGILQYSFAGTNDWQHVCHNLLNSLSNVEGYNLRLANITLNAVESDGDLFIDNVFVGTSSSITDSDLTALRGMRKLPQTDIKLEGVSVAISGNTYTVTMMAYECATGIPVLEAAYGTDSGGGVYTATPWGTASVAIVRTQDAAPAVGGSFTVTLPTLGTSYGGTASAIPWDVEASELENHLETIAGLSNVYVTREGTCRGYTWEVRFEEPAGNHEPLSATGAFTNPDADIATSTLVNGGLYLNPVPGDWLRVAHSSPQVEITINNVPSKCAQSLCSFQLETASTPVISNSALSGSILTISGSKFSPDTDGNTVRVGSTDCTVVSETATEIQCSLMDAQSGTQNVVVTVDLLGKSNEYSITIPITVTSLTPTSGSIAGGTVLTIEGLGFSDDTQVKLNDTAVCDILDISYNIITCKTNPNAVGEVDVIVGDNVISDSSQKFTFEDAVASGSVSPTVMPVTGGVVTITGSGFGATSTENAVYMNSVQIEVLTWTDTSISATAPSLPAATYTVDVYMHPHGFADLSAGNEVEYVLSATSLSAPESSIMGGRRVTIEGSGFEGDVEVLIGEIPCADVVVQSATSVTCMTGSASTTHSVANTGTGVNGLGYAWEPNTLSVNTGDKVRWAWSQIDGVSGAAYQVFSTSSALSVDYNGNGFDSGSPTAAGAFEYQFNTPGTYYYGGSANAASNIFIRGMIEVTDPATSALPVVVRIDGHEATNPAGQLSLEYSKDTTPVISGISPSVGTSDQLITITGSGFSVVMADNDVTIGDTDCIVESASDTTLTCRIDSSQEPVIGQYQEVKVRVNGKGYSWSEIQTHADRYFAVLPHVSSVSPNVGSLLGGTEVTISGGGLSDAVSVEIGGVPCSITSASYSSVLCTTTSASAEGNHNVEVTANSVGSSHVAECISSSCEFSYSSAAAMTLQSVTPSEVNGETEFTIGWNGQATDTVEVLIGSTSCIVSAVTDSDIICKVDGMAAGSYDVSVNVAGKGLASGTFTITSPATLLSISPSSGSVNGFTTVTIIGNGFDVTNTDVSIGSMSCDVLAVTTNEIQCVTPPSSVSEAMAVTVSSFGASPQLQFVYRSTNTPEVTQVSPSQGLPGDTITLDVTVNTYTQQPSVELGGVSCIFSHSDANSITCTLGSRYGGDADVAVVFPEFGKADVATGITFSYQFEVTQSNPLAGTLGGNQELTITGNGFSDSSTVTICGQAVSAVTAQSSSSLTVLTPANIAGVCDVVVSNPGSSATSPNSFTYDASLTPEITGVSPATGGTGGGTVLTISGSKLTLVNEVTIDGSECTIASITDAEITCTTASHAGSVNAQIACSTASGGVASGDVKFHYVDRWSSTFTWGGGDVPQDGEFIYINEGQTILLDTTTNKLKMLLIQGGELIFENAGHVHLQAENILITNGGLLQIGTEEEEYTAQAEITMHGNLHSTELPIYGAKTLGVRDGRLEMHGKHVDDTWALLDTTAAAGSNQITLSMAVSWSVGDRIVIASTGSRHSQIENEELEIAAITVTGGKTVITLADNLEYEHLGVTETYTDSDGNAHEYDYRAEVGLLTRNIVFRGSEELSWAETIPRCEDGFDTGMFVTQTCFQGRHGEEAGSDEFGASIMIHSKAPNTNPNNAVAQARIEYVEFNYVGQAFRLGRYPIHWHLMGDMTGNYVRGCAIHRTFNRAVTIHNTHNLLVERNVIYNVMGGAFFIEDGIETGNVIQYNLAVFVRQSTSLLNDDITPAAYWVTNPNNTIQHNYAAGGTHFGFWYRMHEHPDGPSFDPTICQQNVELGVFRNNSAHSQGWFGLWIFQKYLPKEGSGCDAWQPMAAKFYSLTSWHCEKGAEWVEGGAIQFIDFKLASNEDSGIDIKLIFGTQWSKEDRGALIQNSLIVGRANFEETSAEGKYGIVLPFAPGLWMDGVTFVNFEQSGHTALVVTHISGTCTTLCGGFHYRSEGASFIDTETRITWRWEHEGVIEDLDGSFTGDMVPSKIVPRSDIYNDGTSCQELTDVRFSPSGGYPAMKCVSDASFHRLAFNEFLPSSAQFKNATFTDENNHVAKSYNVKKRLTHGDGWMVLLLGKRKYRMGIENGGSYVNMTYNAKFYDFFEGDYIIIEHEMPQAPSRIALCGDTTEECDPITVPPSSESNTIDSSSSNREWQYDDVEGLFTYMVTRQTSTRKKRGSMSWQQMDGLDISNYIVRPVIERCLYENCEVPSASGSLPDVFGLEENAITVNSFADTGDCFVVTGDGDEREVTVPADCWIQWNISSGVVNKLDVVGTLVFSDDQDISLTATYIVVTGRFIGGFSIVSPRTHRLDITLQGTPTTNELITNSGVVIGSKALACHGTCDLHGNDVGSSWVKLVATANAGSNQLVLNQAVKWNVGDEVVVAPSGFNAWRTEKHTITSISEDKRTLTLENNLQYQHKHEIRSFGSQPEIDFSAEVGLLTRSIKIMGEESPDSFGARVLVTTTALTYTAKLRFSNVEFLRTGQEGHYDDYDPRHSVAFKSAGSQSEVRNCAFHDGYSTAIGTYGTDNAKISGNVIHHTVNEGVVIKGFGHELTNNLVVLNIFRGSYNGRYEASNYDYTAAINVETATFLTMTGNVVAGAERVAYRIAGQPCETEGSQLWTDNVAHATLLGTAHMKTALQGCSLVNGFTLYNVWDFAIYHQTTDSVRVENCIIADATVGYMPLIAGPAPLTHMYEAKTATVTNSTFVARRDPTDCDVDMSESTDRSLIIRRIAGVNKKAPSTPSGGRSGVMLALFEGEYNGATFKALHVNMNYPALYGLLSLEGITFANFKTSCSARDVILYTNPINEDVFHPTHLSGITKENCDEESSARIDRPEISNINPSDCVDMQCDAKLKVLINDLDGSFLGSVGSIISQSEYDWGNQALGLGDYRIPKPMLAAADGSKLSADSIVPNKGIARNGTSCQLMDTWQAYKCTKNTYQYRMMIIESLDSDTETRRLSPVALRVGDTVDLNNGPQDHGWCSGYTCQKRISTFYTIVPLGQHVDIYFTSTPPQEMKLHLINAPSDEKVTVSIWVPNPQKHDVYIDDTLIEPINRNGNRLEKAPASNPDQFKPSASTASPGENYLDFDEQKLYFCLAGGIPIHLQTQPAIIVNMMFPAVSIDEFFETNLVSTLASFLRIDESMIRTVNVVTEQSRRKRSGTVEYTAEVAAASPEEALAMRSAVIVEYQTNGMFVGAAQASSLSLSQAQTAAYIAEMDTELQNGEVVSARSQVLVPTKIRVTTVPEGEELSALTTSPVIEILDDSDVVVTEADAYHVVVSLDTSVAGADGNAVLSGTTNVTFSQGVATFSGLVISHSGTYNLVFSPSLNLSDVSVAVTVRDRSICAGITGFQNPDQINDGDDLPFQLQLTNCSGSNLEDVAHKGYTYKIDVTFDDSALYGSAVLGGTTTFDFDAAGALTISGLSLSNTANYNVYNLNFRFYTSPSSSYDKSVGIEKVQIYPSSSADFIHADTSNLQILKLTFDEDYSDVTGGAYAVETLETGFYNDIVRQYPALYFSLFTASSSSDGKLQISTSVIARNMSSITDFYKEFDTTGSLSVGSVSVNARSTCAIQVSGNCYDSSEQATTDNGGMTTIIVFSVLGVCAVLAIGIIGATYLMKRHNLSKISAVRCTDGSPNSLRPLHDVENEISWSRTSSPSSMEYRMTPVGRN